MVTILLLVSRREYLEKVVSRLELLECDQSQTNILCLVDGGSSLYVRTRNLIAETKFNNRLTIQIGDGKAPKIDIPSRRARIARAHNKARELITDDTEFILSVEDDTLVPIHALEKLLREARFNRSIGIIEGVELGRWSIPYVGAWICDDIYEPTRLTSVKNKPNSFEIEPIDGTGLYCSLIRADMYKKIKFTSRGGLGPDVNFALELRRLGFQNYIHWGVKCTHLTNENGEELIIDATSQSQEISLVKVNDTLWLASD